MWYWRDENFKGLHEIGARLANEPDLTFFANYCLPRERGLRQQAFAALNAFVQHVATLTVERRRDIVSGLLEAYRHNPGITDLVPHPLRSNLITPTLLDWQKASPTDPVPFRLAGSRDDLRYAIRLAQEDDETVARLVSDLRAGLAMACHELPAGIVGDPSKALEDVAEIEQLIPLLAPSDQPVARSNVARYRTVIENYARWLLATDRGRSFQAWAEARDLRFKA